MRRNLIFKILLLVLALVPPAIATVYMVVLPARAANTALSAESKVSVPKGNENEIAEYLALRLEEAFLKNRLAMAKAGSVGLVVDLIEKSVSLDIRGVPVRECPIKELRVSGAFARMKRRPDIIKWVASPHVLRKEWTTIVKQPIKVKIAPKNEAEAEAQPSDKYEEDNGDVQYSLRFAPDVTLHIEQVVPEMTTADWREKFKNDLRQKWDVAKESLRQLARHELPEHDISITIKLAPSDARAIYRALPDDARMALRL